MAYNKGLHAVLIIFFIFHSMSSIHIRTRLYSDLCCIGSYLGGSTSCQEFFHYQSSTSRPLIKRKMTPSTAPHPLMISLTINLSVNFMNNWHGPFSSLVALVLTVLWGTGEIISELSNYSCYWKWWLFNSCCFRQFPQWWFLDLSHYEYETIMVELKF